MPSYTRDQARQISLKILTDATDGVQTIAANALSSDLTLARIQLETALRHLRRLDYLRGIAEGVVQAYQKLWYLEAATFSVTKYSDDEQSDMALAVSNVRVQPGCVDTETVSMEDIEAELARRLANSSIDDEDSFDITLFCDDLDCFLEGATGSTASGSFTLATARSQVLSEYENRGVDGVAQALLPEAWHAAREGLELIEVERAAQDRLANLRLAAQVMFALSRNEPKLQSAKLWLVTDHTTGAWKMKLNSVQAVKGGFPASYKLGDRLDDELDDATLGGGAASSPISTVQKALPCLVGAVIGKKSLDNAIIAFDRDAIESCITADGQPLIDEIAKALMPTAWAEVVHQVALMAPPQRLLVADGEQDVSLLPQPRAAVARPRPRQSF
jgi:hypothetical protein